MEPDLVATVDELLSLAAAQAPIQALQRQLPAMPASGGAGPGLYVDAVPAEAYELDGSVRVTVLRVYSVGSGQPQLIGRIQACRGPPGVGRVHFHYYLHLVGTGVCVDLRAPDPWFLEVLDLHYIRGGGEVQLRTTDLAA